MTKPNKRSRSVKKDTLLKFQYFLTCQKCGDSRHVETTIGGGAIVHKIMGSEWTYRDVGGPITKLKIQSKL